MHILSEYESWGLCGVVKEVMGVWQYDDTDLDRLCTIMTLHDLGFSIAETQRYMRLLLEQPHTEQQRNGWIQQNGCHRGRNKCCIRLQRRHIGKYRYIWSKISVVVWQQRKPPAQSKRKKIRIFGDLHCRW